MNFTFAEWPFLTAEKRTPEENDRWWNECYTPPPAEVTLRGIERSVIVSGALGSGKTTLLQAFERAESAHYLLVYYPPTYWPGEIHAWIKSYGHLGQIMARASITLKNVLAIHPEKFTDLSDINQEYLRWLIEKYSGRRAVLRWADATGFHPLLKLLKQPFDDIYPTVTELPDVQGQIEELVTLSYRMGFEKGVAVLIDVNGIDSTDNVMLEKLSSLFKWLTPLQFNGFAIKAVIPSKILMQTDIEKEVRGRATFTTLNWTTNAYQQLINRYIDVACEGQLKSLGSIVNDKLIKQLQSVLTPFGGGMLPQNGVQLVHLLLEHYAQTQSPLDITNFEELLRTYFSYYIPLRLNFTNQGIWQGEKFTHLDNQPFSILEVLWHHRNSDADAYEALMNIAGNTGNLNTIISRLRQQIEPIPKKPIYIQNTRSRGYWLENFSV